MSATGWGGGSDRHVRRLVGDATSPLRVWLAGLVLEAKARRRKPPVEIRAQMVFMNGAVECSTCKRWRREAVEAGFVAAWTEHAATCPARRP